MDEQTAGAAERVRRQAMRLTRDGASLTIDADVHLTDPETLPDAMHRQMEATPNYFHGRPISAEDALAEMAMAGVDMALVWQNPSATPYGDDLDANHAALLAANRYIADAALAHPERFIPAGWTDPKALGFERSAALVETLIERFGFVVVKMNPAQNAYPIDSEDVFRTVDLIVERGAVPAFHIGSDTPFTPPEGLAKVARRHPDHPVIAVHMGGGGAAFVEAEENYQTIRRLGLELPNIFFALSAKRDTHCESDLITYQLAGAPFKTNIACASDAPYGRMTWNFGGYRLMFESLLDGAKHTDPRLRKDPGAFNAEDVAGYLGGNIAALIVRASDRWLARYGSAAPVGRVA